MGKMLKSWPLHDVMHTTHLSIPVSLHNHLLSHVSGALVAASSHVDLPVSAVRTHAYMRKPMREMDADADDEEEEEEEEDDDDASSRPSSKWPANCERRLKARRRSSLDRLLSAEALNVCNSESSSMRIASVQKACTSNGARGGGGCLSREALEKHSGIERSCSGRNNDIDGNGSLEFNKTGK